MKFIKENMKKLSLNEMEIENPSLPSLKVDRGDMELLFYNFEESEEQKDETQIISSVFWIS